MPSADFCTALTRRATRAVRLGLKTRSRHDADLPR